MIKNILPLATMEKLLKKSGAPRVAESGKEALREALEDFADKLGKKSLRYAKHAGRKTIRKEDIKEALKD